MLNGEPGRRILHCRGVRQEDPLSHMLFILAMEPLHLLFKKAQELGLLEVVSKGCEAFRVSLYDDDVAIFIKPSEQDWLVTNSILDTFAEASGLSTNLSKTELYPIRCETSSLEFLTTSFPCTYLGLPLHIKKLPKSLLHLVIQKIANKLTDWQRVSHISRKKIASKFGSVSITNIFLDSLQDAQMGLCKDGQI
jgi:hypothetical protein